MSMLLYAFAASALTAFLFGVLSGRFERDQ